MNLTNILQILGRLLERWNPRQKAAKWVSSGSGVTLRSSGFKGGALSGTGQGTPQNSAVAVSTKPASRQPSEASQRYRVLRSLALSVGGVRYPDSCRPRPSCSPLPRWLPPLREELRQLLPCWLFCNRSVLGTL